MITLFILLSTILSAQITSIPSNNVGVGSGSGPISTVIFTSQIAGIHQNGSLSANTGTDDKATLQAVLNTSSATVPLILIVDGVVAIDTTTAGLVVNSYTTIRGLGLNTGFSWLGSANVNQQCLITNANPLGTGTSTDKSIVIENLTINGNGASGHGGSGAYAYNANSAGLFLAAVRLVGVTNVTLRDLKTISIGGYGLHVANSPNTVVSNYRVEHDSTKLSDDGLHINGPMTNVTISNISGTSGDDLLSIAADDGHMVGSTGNVGVYGNNALATTIKYGSITGCLVNGVYAEGSVTAFRLLSAVSNLDCTIRNVQGSTIKRIAFIDNDDIELHPVGLGNFGTVILENINVNPTANYDTEIELGAVFQTLKIGLVSREYTLAHPMLTTTSNTSIQDLRLDLQISNMAGFASPFMIHSAGVINRLSMTGVYDAGYGSGQSTYPILLLSGGTLETLEVSSFIADRINSIVSATSGILKSTVWGPGRHTRASSNGSFNIGITVPNCTVSGWSTALFKSGAGSCTNIHAGFYGDSVADPL